MHLLILDCIVNLVLIFSDKFQNMDGYFFIGSLLNHSPKWLSQKSWMKINKQKNKENDKYWKSLNHARFTRLPVAFLIKMY